MIDFLTDGQIAAEPMLRFFRFDHLPERLQLVSQPYAILACTIAEACPRNAERTVALRKLLESKDCAVRSFIP